MSVPSEEIRRCEPGPPRETSVYKAACSKSRGLVPDCSQSQGSVTMECSSFRTHPSGG